MSSATPVSCGTSARWLPWRSTTTAISRAVARERQLQAERDHWRTLLEVTNAVVTQRDVAALRAAIVPNVRRIVLHDHTNLYLIDEQRRSDLS